MFFYSEVDGIVLQSVTRTVSANTAATASIPGLITMTIPSGALSSSTTITISQLEASSTQLTSSLSASELTASSYIFKFEPAGLTFSQPVMITIPIPVGSTTTPVIYYTVSGNNNIYQELPTINNGSGSLIAYVTHFSNAFVGETGQIKYWLTTLGDAGAEAFYDLSFDSYGNAYVVGLTDSSGSAGVEDALLTKVNNNGSVVWQRSLGLSGWDRFMSVTVDSLNNAYVVGGTGTTSGDATNDIVVVKYNDSGSLQWQKRLSGSATDTGMSINTDRSGNLILAGATNSTGGQGSYDAYIAKLSPSGSITWQKSLGGAGDDQYRDAIADSAGNIYAVGYSNSTGGAGNYDTLLVKYNSSGSVVWQRSLGGSAADSPYLGGTIVLDTSGNPYIAFTCASQGQGGNDVGIAKYDTSGALQWQRIIGASSTEQYPSIAIDNGNNLYVTAHCNSETQGGYDILVCKYNSSGTLLTQRTLGGNKDETAWKVRISPSQDMWIAGSTKSIGNASEQSLIAKLKTDGSMTGSYGSFTYRESGLISIHSALTSNNRALTEATRTFSITDSSFVSAERALSSRKTFLGTTSDYWFSTLGGTGIDYGRSVAVDSNGDYVTVGYTNSQGAGNYDGIIVKYSASGTIKWQKRIGGTGDDFLIGVAVDGYNNIYVAGYTTSQGSGIEDVLVAKYDANGALQWQRTLGGTGEETCYGLSVTSAGDIYIAARTGSQITGVRNVLVAKYNTNGVIQWQRSIGGASADRALNCAVDSSNNVYLVGVVASQGAGGDDAFICKYNSSGVLQWQRSLGGTGSESGNGIVVGSSGNFYICGYTTSQGQGGNDLFVAKYNSNGVIQWQRRLGSTGTDNGNAISVDIDENVYVCGSTGTDILVAKYDLSGTLIWQRSFVGADDETALGITVDSAGSIIISGATSSSGVGNYDCIIIKLPADGSLTGTYGTFTYGASSLVGANSTLTDVARTLTDAPRTLNDSAATLSAATSTLSSNIFSLNTAPTCWMNLVGGAGYDFPDLSYPYLGNGLAIDSLGYIYTADHTTSQGFGDYDLLITKYNSYGVIIWQRILGGVGTDRSASIGLDSSGNIFVSASITSETAGNYDIFIAKYNSNGVLQWQKRLGGTGEDLASELSIDSSGNVYLVGKFWTGSSNYITIAKYDTNGNLLWQKQLGSTWTAMAASSAMDSSNNLYISAISDAPSTGGQGGVDVVVVKFDNNGNLIWQKSVGTSANYDFSTGIRVDSSDNIFLTAYISANSSNFDVLVAQTGALIKLDSSGNILWQKYLGSSGNESFMDVAVDTKNNVYVAGYTNSQGLGDRDILIAKYNSSGTLLWQKIFGGNGTDVGTSIVVDTKGFMYISGYTTSGGIGLYDRLLLKLPSNGSLTGNYGTFTYKDSTLAESTPSFTSVNRTLTLSNSSYTSATTTLSDKSTTRSSTFQPTYWISTVGGSGSDYTWDAKYDISGNLYVAASTTSSGQGATEALALKFNADGVLEWQRTLGGTGNDYFTGVGIDAQGNVYFSGHTTSQGQGSTDIVIAKYNSNGTLQWQKTIGSTSSDRFFSSIQFDSSNNFYIAGSTASQTVGQEDALLIKFDTSGNILWQRTLGGTGNDYFWAVKVDSSGNVFAAGQTSSAGPLDDILLAKYDSSGNLLWQRTVGGAGTDAVQGIEVDQSGNVYGCCNSDTSSSGGYDTITFKFDSDGNLLWQRSIAGTAADVGRRVTVGSDGFIYIAGTTASQTAGGDDILIAKYNSSGVIQWQRRFGGSAAESIFAITTDNNGNIVVVGSTATNSFGSDDVLFIKLPNDGTLTGTYGSYTYVATTLTEAQKSLSAATSTLTSATRTLGITTSTLTGASSALSQTRTNISTALVSSTQNINTAPSLWIGRIGTASTEETGGVVADSAGNVYLLSRTNYPGNYDILLTKQTSTGTFVWQKRFSGAGVESVRGLTIDSSDSIYVCGTTTTSGAGGNDIYVAKLNTEGVIAWQKTIGGTGDDTGTGIAVDSFGNVYVTGYTNSQGAGSYDAYVAKLDSSGNIVWQRSLGGSLDDRSYGIGIDILGNVYISGYTASQGAGSTDVFVAKYNSFGSILWQRSLGISLYDNAYQMSVDLYGNVYIAGTTDSTALGGVQMLLAKYDTNGNISWQRTLSGCEDDVGCAAAVDSYGNVYVGGYSTSIGTTGANDLVIAKFDSSGTIIWQRMIGGTNQDYSSGHLFVDKNGMLYISGYTSSITAGSTDSIVIKIPTNNPLVGTHGSFICRTSALTVSSVSLTNATRTLTDSARTLTASSASLSLVDVYGSLTTAITSITEQAEPAAASVSVNYWWASLGGASSDRANSVGVDSCGNVYSIGWTASAGAGSNDFFVGKYNKDGTLLWQRALGSTGSESNVKGTVDTSGNIYFVGNGNTIVKYNTNGALQWQKSIAASTGTLYMYDIAVDPSGYIYICGTYTTSTSYQYGYVAKLDGNANVIWQKTLGSANTSTKEFSKISVDSSGNVHVTGFYSSTRDVAITAKYDTNGNLQWQRVIQPIYGSRPSSISVDSSGNVYIGGRSQSVSTSAYEPFLAKYNSAGTLQFMRRVTNNNTSNTVVACDSSGYIYMASQNGSIMTFDSSGTIQLQYTYNAPTTVPFDIISNSGVIYIAGYANAVGYAFGSYTTLSSYDMIMYKLSSYYQSLMYPATSFTISSTNLTNGAGGLVDATVTVYSLGTRSYTDQAIGLSSNFGTIS